MCFYWADCYVMGNQNSKVLVWVIIEYSSLYCKQDHKRCFEWKCGSECGNWYLQVSGRINPLMTETSSWSIRQTSIQKKTSSTYCWSRWVREGFEKAPYCKWLVVFESKTICDLFLHCRCDVGLSGCLLFWYLLPEIWSLIIVILSFSEIVFLVM